MRFYLSIPPEGEATLSAVQPKVIASDILFEVEVNVGLPEGMVPPDRKMTREKALAMIQATVRGKGDFSMGVREPAPR